MATINAWGSADPAQVTFGGTGLNACTTGDVLYGSASNTLSRLAIGSTGNVLQVVAGLPAWGAIPGGTTPWVFLQSKTAAGSPANIAFDNTVMTSTYPYYMFIIQDLYPTASDDILAQLSSNNGSTYVNTGYHTCFAGLGPTASSGSSTTQWTIYKSISSTGGTGIGGNLMTLFLSNLTTNSNTHYPVLNGWGSFNTTGASAVIQMVGGSLFTAAT